MPTQPQASEPPRRDPALDGLRGLAVLLVLLFHYGGGLRAHNPLLRALGYLTQAGWMGVNIFFALSGFLITGLLVDTSLEASPSPTLRLKARGLRNFYVRRALRILPLYFGALLVCATAALLNGASFAQLKPLLVYAAFLQNLPFLLNASLHTPPPLPVFHLWSLAVEEQFYLLWPFALIAARTPRRALHLSLYTFVASCLFRLVVFSPHLVAWSTAGTFATFLPTRAGALALGSALALYRPPEVDPNTAISTEAKRSGQTPAFPSVGAKGGAPAGLRSSGWKATSQQATPLILILTALALILLTALQTHALLLNSRPAFLILLPAADLLAAALVAFTLSPNRLRSMLGNRPLIFFGTISYGIYIFHILLEPLVDDLGTAITHAGSGSAYQAARLVVALPLSTLAAWLSFTLLEQPFLRLKRLFPRTPKPVG